MLGSILALLVIVILAKCILMGLKPQLVILLGGLILLYASIAIGTGGSILPNKVTSTGSWVFDPFKTMASLFSTRTAALGMIIMSATGYAKYMDIIGASKIMTDVMTVPLRILKSPYVVLGIGYIIGQIINIFVPSASGLGTLLMVTMYPILVGLGVSPLSAAAVVGTAACLDLGPASGNSNLAAKYGDLEPIEYFVSYQIPVSIITMIVIAFLHTVVQKYYDKKDNFVPNISALPTENPEKGDEKNIPFIYFFLPILPLALLLIFSRFVVSSIKLDVPITMFMCFVISMILEMIRHRRNIKKVLADAMDFYNAMGKSFATVITLIIAGEVFAQGLMASGAVDMMINSVKGLGLGAAPITVAMVLLISVSAVLMGSGNAPFFAFASLAPAIAKEMTVSAVSILLPMQLAAGIARSVSPITGVIVAVAGMAAVNPFDLVKRTAIPMLGGLIAMTIASIIMY